MVETTSNDPEDRVLDLVHLISQSLVDHPDDVSVEMFEDRRDHVIELRVAPDDLGKVIGRQGRTVRALRTLLATAGLKQGRRYLLEVIE